MDALILAAGYGSRIRGLSACKPLTPVQGTPLIEHAISAVAAAGARRVVVSTGWRGDEVEAALPAIACRHGVTVETCRVPDYDKPNGHSVIAGASRIDGDYLLIMSDHLFSRPILGTLARQGRSDRGVTLAIDRQIAGRHVDPDDATWVRLAADGRIRQIGKGLDRYDAVDCGAFLATGELIEAIGSAIDAGRPGSLTDGMQVLADRGRAATMDIGDAWWIDVDDPAMHALAEIRLREGFNGDGTRQSVETRT